MTWLDDTPANVAAGWLVAAAVMILLLIVIVGDDRPKGRY